MDFSFSFGKKRKMQKLIGNYVNNRIKEKMAFNRQIESLEAQLKEHQIDQNKYERLRAIIEIREYQKQQEQWVRIENRYHNPLNS